MKKYIKPELFYERYELSQHIADCAWEFKGLTTENVCRVEADADKIGFSGVLFNNECELDVAVVESYCYQNSQDTAYKSFAS